MPGTAEWPGYRRAGPEFSAIAPAALPATPRARVLRRGDEGSRGAGPGRGPSDPLGHRIIAGAWLAAMDSRLPGNQKKAHLSVD